MKVHLDCVRAVSSFINDVKLWLTGGYDHTIFMWDVRCNSCLLKMDHGTQVEDLVVLSTGILAISVGGSNLCLWDLSSGGKLLKKIKNYQNTISCVCLGKNSSCNQNLYILTGSLDESLRIHKLNDLKVLHTWKHPYEVLSINVAKDFKSIAVGMVEGSICIYKLQSQEKRKIYFSKNESERMINREIINISRHKLHLRLYDRWLKRSRYREALDVAMLTRSPKAVMTVFSELIKRGRLDNSLKNRTVETIIPIIDFLSKFIAEPLYTKNLIQVFKCLLNSHVHLIEQHDFVNLRLQSLRKYLVYEIESPQ